MQRSSGATQEVTRSADLHLRNDNMNCIFREELNYLRLNLARPFVGDDFLPVQFFFSKLHSIYESEIMQNMNKRQRRRVLVAGLNVLVE